MTERTEKKENHKSPKMTCVWVTFPNIIPPKNISASVKGQQQIWGYNEIT